MRRSILSLAVSAALMADGGAGFRGSASGGGGSFRGPGGGAGPPQPPGPRVRRAPVRGGAGFWGGSVANGASPRTPRFSVQAFSFHRFKLRGRPRPGGNSPPNRRGPIRHRRSPVHANSPGRG